MKYPRSNRSFLVVALLAATTLPSCSHGPSHPALFESAFADDALTSADAVAFRAIQSLYSGGSYDSALKGLLDFYKAYPQSHFTAQARNLHGLIFILTKRPQQAVYHFERSLEISDNDDFKQYVRFNLAAAHFDSGLYEEARRVLTQIDTSALDRPNQVKYHGLRAKVAIKLGDSLGALAEYLAAAEHADTPAARQVFADPVEQTLGNIQESAEIDSIYREHEDSALADLLLFKLGTVAYRAGLTSTAETRFQTLSKRFPLSRHYSEAQDMLRAIESRSVVSPQSIGVLLPMKGRFSKFGLKNLQAISLAFRIFNLSEPATPIKLIIEDSGEDANSAIKALDKLYFEHHVIGVIGPLLSKGIEEVSQKAQELGLPLITLSQQRGVSGDFIFQAGFTPQLQAYAIAQYAVEKLGLKRFAILSPRDNFGEEFSQRYWDAIESFGGEVVGAETYASGETDFRQAVDRLSGLYYKDARADETEALAALRLKDDIKKRTRKTESYFALKPIVDYQAVFIPDEPKVVGQILPTFAYRDVTDVQFLGINTWNSAELLRRAQRHVEGAFFTEAFSSESKSALTRKFVKKFKDIYGNQPDAMEALAFDAASLVEHALTSGADSRSDLRDALTEVSNFPGVTGRISWRDGLFSRDVTIMTVKDGRISEAKAIPDATASTPEN